jgi:hypothetical protein
MTLSCSNYAVLLSVVFLILFYFYPEDERKYEGNIFLINNMW